MKNSKVTKNAQYAATENRILQQAVRLFLEKGYHGTSIDEITRAAGLTKGALYWHFKSKEDLLQRIVSQYEKNAIDGMIQTVEKVEGGVVEKFMEHTRFNSAFAVRNRELCISFTTLAAELVGAHHPIEAEIRRIYGKYRDFLAGLVKEGKRQKVFKKDLDPELVALSLLAFFDGVLLHWFINQNTVDGKAYVTTCTNIWLKGLMA